MTHPPPVIYYCTVHSWFGRQHFYQGLAHAFARTRHVLYVSGPLLWPAASTVKADKERVCGGYLSRVDKRLWVLEPIVPRGSRFQLIHTVQNRLAARATIAAASQLGIDPKHALLWCYNTAAMPVLRSLPLIRSVYWTGDDVIEPGEPALLGLVDDVFAVSPDALALKRRHVGERAIQMPMAINPGPFIQASREPRTPADLRYLKRPLLGFGGALNWRTDWSLLQEIVRQGIGTVVLVGPILDSDTRRHVDELEATGAAVWLGHRNAEQSPHYLAAFDVGLVPYKRNRFNDGSNPVKFYEYLAAGIPVVSTALPALAAFFDVARFADEPDRFADAVADAAAAPRSGADAVRRQAVARQHSFEALISRIDEHLAAVDRRRNPAHSFVA